MATIAAVETPLPRNAEVVVWDLLTNVNASGDAVELPVGACSVQVSGTFGGATVAMHGSNDGSAYAALVDLAGVAIGISAAGFKSVGDRPRYIKPVTTGGGGTQSLKVTLLVPRHEL